jgi:hypothetical protein
VLGVLAAVGTITFAPLVVKLVYGEQLYAPAAVDLAILSPYVSLVYCSIVLGAGIAAASLQLRWALTQCLCLLVSITLDPLLIPWSQARYGNGGIGVCIGVGLSEIAMVTLGMRLMPSGSHASLGSSLRRCLVAGAAMGVVGWLLRPFPYLAIPITVAVYGGVLYVQGEVDDELLSLFRTVLASRLKRKDASGETVTTAADVTA